jgi:hypothetical protein
MLASAGFVYETAKAFDRDHEPGSANPILTERVKAIFDLRNCTFCHGPHGEAGLNVLDFTQLFTGTAVGGMPYIDRVKPENSLLYTKVLTDSMPQIGDKLTPEEKVSVLEWIKAEVGAVSEGSVVITESQISDLIAGDLSKMSPEYARDSRYFVLVNESNNALVSDADLQIYRESFFKLLNSLTWTSGAIMPVALDEAKTIYRVRLSELGWNAGLWEQMLVRYPYGLYRATLAENEIRKATGTSIAAIRIDWFAANASRPPLYHALLGLPGTLDALAQTVSVSIAQDIQAGRVARAGFRGGQGNPQGSGVSDNNRMIERHEARYGAFWLSYDFATSDSDQDLFKRPLGPAPGPFGFKHSGGEVIFNLPNGLQAYLIVNSKGGRLDEAPLNVVQDKGNGGRAVVNGISCMGCHSAGMNRKADQILSFAKSDPSLFGSSLAEIQRLYPEQSALFQLFDQDQKRFLDALRAAGVEHLGRDPINVMARRFDAAVDMTRAAAEFGMSEEEFRRRLGETPALAQIRAALDSGGITRAQFAGAFTKIARNLSLGDVHDPVMELARGTSAVTIWDGGTPRWGCGINQSSQLKCWGRPGGQWNDGYEKVEEAVNSKLKARPVAVVSSGDSAVVSLCVIEEGGRVTCTPIQEDQDTNHPYKDTVLNVPSALRAKTLSLSAVTAGAACAIDESDRLVCWGQTNQPTNFGISEPVLQAQVGVFTPCAILEDHSVLCPGVSAEHQPPPGLRARAISSYGSGTCAITDNLAVQCWGTDIEGRLHPPADLPAAIAVTTGFRFSCALLEDRSVRCWGRPSAVDPVLHPSELRNVRAINLAGYPCVVRTDDSTTCAPGGFKVLKSPGS